MRRWVVEVIGPSDHGQRASAVTDERLQFLIACKKRGELVAGVEVLHKLGDPGGGSWSASERPGECP